jgi:histidinol-phosphate aminotransferase
VSAQAATVLAPASIDAAVALVPRVRVLLVREPAAPMVAALAAAVRGTNCTIICGTERELALAPEIAAAIGPGRLVLAREWLLDRDAVRHGRRGAALTSEGGEHPRLRGESPLPVSPVVRAALLRAVGHAPLHRYPVEAARRVEAALAARLGVGAGQVVVSGGGSAELISRCLRAFADAGDEVAATLPVWDALADLCTAEGLALRHAEDLTGANARLVYVASPNNPDGRRTGAPDLKAIRAALPADRVLLLDEAWRGFDDPPSPWTPGADSPDGPVITLRTFSKAHALAGLRVGYATGPEPVMGLLRRFASPGGLPVLAAEAALAALADDDEPRRAQVRTTRAHVAERLRSAGLEVTDTGAHVLIVRGPEERLAALDAAAARHGIALGEADGLPGARVLEVPAPDDAERVLSVLESA